MKIILRIFIFIIGILGILFVLDFVMKKVDNAETIDYENFYVNMLNGEKLTVEFCKRGEGDYTILHKGEELGKKTKKRILIVGDSFVWPHSNRNLNTMWWMRLQYLLEKEGYNDVEIIAAGVSGIGTIDEINMILENEEMMKKIDPDLIIIGLVMNDSVIDNPNDERFLDGFDRDKFIEDHYNNKFYKLFSKVYPNLYNKFIETMVDDKFNTDKFNEKYGSKYGYGVDYIFNMSRTEEGYKLYEEDAVKYIASMETPVFVYSLSLFDDFIDRAEELYKKYDVTFYGDQEKANDFAGSFSDFGYISIQNEEDSHPAEILNDYYARDILEILENDYKNIIGKKGKVKNFELSINDYLPYEIELEKIDDVTYKLKWPDKYLKYPLNYEFIKLNLKYPKEVKSVILESNNIKSSKLWYNKYNEDKNFREVKGDNKYEINDEIFSLNIHLELIDEDNREFILKLEV